VSPRAAKKSKLPFGGIQVIITGDFAQLPPVVKNQSPAAPRTHLFECDAWKELFPDNNQVCGHRRGMLVMIVIMTMS
jgi:hypothetical protein